MIHTIKEKNGKNLVPTLKPKEQKSFFKDAQLGRFIGKELEEELRNI